MTIFVSSQKNLHMNFKTLIIALILPYCMQAQYTYPTTMKSDQKDDYHGTTVADPYRWLEDDNSQETKDWFCNPVL